MRLGILASHPIQYHAPWFRGLAKRVDLEVFFAHRQTPEGQADGGFGVAFDWDVDLLSGYQHRFLKNVSARPGVNHFTGCDTPEIADIVAGTKGLRDYGTTGPEEGPEVSSQWSVVSGQRSKHFDAFIVSGWQLKSYWQAVRACRRARVPVLVRGDSQLLTPRSPLKRIAKEIIHRFLVRQFHGFLYVGQRNREYLKHYGAPDNGLFFVPHLVDNEWFNAKAEIARKQRTEIRRQWAIPEDAFCLLFCGKFIPQKRPLDLGAAARLLSPSNSQLPAPSSMSPPIHLLFVGSGELGAQLRAHCRVVFDAESAPRGPVVRGPVVRSPVVSGPVFSGPVVSGPVVSVPSVSGPVVRGPVVSKPPSASFTGFLNQSEMSRAYVAADVLVLPSISETWGLVVNEAMACGLPAVVSDAAGCAPDLIEAGKTGFTFPAGDPAQLAQRLASLLEMKQHGHDFRPALAEKMRTYCTASALSGTLKAVETLAAKRLE
jgi:glycosyltransferase involved in cell wall biosynthesis